MVDLDGDGEDEAVVYCKTTGELPLGIYVFDRQNEAFTLAASVQGAGSAFHHVSYVAFDDQPGYELVVGRQISDQVPQLMNVYSLRGGTLHIAWDRAQNLLYMTGPAAFVFDGTVTL
jgi:hypothetical protein